MISIPTPNIIDYNISGENDLDFEWILIDFVEGQMLSNAWKTTTGDAKERLVDVVVDYTSQLFRIRADAIGSISYDDMP